MPTPRTASSWLVALILAWPLTASAGEKEASGAIEGRVVSAEGSGVPGATVRIGGGRRRLVSVTTDGAGRFRSASLAAGDECLVEASAEGYVPTRIGPLELQAGATLHVDLTLLAQSGEASPPGLIDSGGARAGTSFDAGFIEGLPIIGHNYQDLLPLAPGVTDTDGDGNPNVHGARETSNQYRLDGGDITDAVTGGFGMNLNPLVVESLEIITAGAPAEFGRAMGGFTNVTTRSGGNELDGKLAVFWRGRFFDGDGAGNDDVVRFDEDPVDYRDIRAAGAAGGPIVKDKLWYFGALEALDTESPSDHLGTGFRITSRGTYSFGKLSWQADPLNKLAIQAAADPRSFKGLGLSPLTSLSSDFKLDQGGVTAQASWTSTISPAAVVQATAIRFRSELDIEPVSRFFEPVETLLFVGTSTSGTVLHANYPCSVVNCREAFGERRIYRIDGFTGRVSGPFFQKSDDSRTRGSLRADLSWIVGDVSGEHRIAGGIEIAEEDLRRDLLINPVLIDLTSPIPGTGSVSGFQVLQVARPSGLDIRVTNVSSGFFVSDSWKPRPNIALTAGLRLDQETLDAPGFEPFDPLAERMRSIALWRAVCAEAVRQGVPLPRFSNCHPARTYDGLPPELPDGTLRSFLDEDMDGINDVPAAVAELDLDKDGFVGTGGLEGAEFFKHFTTFAERETAHFEIEDSHVSPRIGVSWDAWGDGGTRLFAHWGRYRDRLRPEILLGEAQPELLSFTFFPNVNGAIVPGVISSSAAVPSINQIDHDLRAPRTDELSLGFERALGPDWIVGATYIRRRGRDLLQDLNHYTCRQSGEVTGIDPLAICGDAEGKLQPDLFGQPGFGFPGPGSSFPNGVEDLYNLTSFFNQVLRVRNLNSSDYTAYEFKAVRPLRRNWQMQASYTYSEATGQAEEFLSGVGDDASAVAAEDGLLGYDQRHGLKFQAVTHLPRGLVVGGAIAWASGTPYSVLRAVSPDVDSGGNILQRTLFPTGQRNDQRNDSYWRLDGRIEKVFTIHKVKASAFLIVENLLDSDTLVIDSVAADRTGLVAARDFGRRFEIGSIFSF